MLMEELTSVRIVTLLDNCVQRSGVLGQWGLSFFIEAVDFNGRKHHLIFDTGGNKEVILCNLEALNIDLSDLEFIVLSHGHDDHTSATVEVMKKAKANAHLKVIAHPYAFLPKFEVTQSKKKIESGIPKGQRMEDLKKAGGEIVLAKHPFPLFPGAVTTGEISRSSDFESDLDLESQKKRYFVINGRVEPDRLLDDNALILNTPLGLLVVTGCAHAGVINTLVHAQRVTKICEICGLVGGMHLSRKDTSYLERTIEELKLLKPRLLSPGHCTGFRALSRLYRAFPNEFDTDFVGKVLEIKENAILKRA